MALVLGPMETQGEAPGRAAATGRGSASRATVVAEDWSDVDVLAAHKRSRDALTALLERWERLFDQAQT